MKKNKSILKLLAVFLVLTLAVGAFCFSSAAASEKRSGDYGYTVLKDGTAQIVKYYGKSAEITVPSKLDGKTVSGIGNNAFELNDKLTSVVIPSSVKKIGEMAFYYCENLKSVTLPKGITTIEYATFSVCSKLSKINLPAGLTRIAERAFYCAGLTKVTLPDSVKTIASEAFSSCQELLEVVLPESATDLGDSAFSNCQILKKATLPSKLKKIPDGLFSQCYELETVNFPSGLTEIGFGAFYMTGITAAPLPNTVKVIGEEAFNWAQKLKSVNLPEGLTEISNRAFSGTTLESVKLPSTIKRIGYGAFSGAMIKEVNVPNGVTEIWQEAFDGCHQLKKVTIPDTVTYLGDSIFKNCDALTDVRLSSKLKEIPDFAFRECRTLKKIVIPNSVTKIGNNAFSMCPVLEDVTLPSKLKELGDTAFYWCFKLSSLTLPDTVEKVGYLAFRNTAIKTMNCPKSLKKCGYNPFLYTPFSAEQSKGGIYWGKWLIGYEFFPDIYDEETDTWKETKVSIKDGTVGIANHTFCPVYEETYPYNIKSIKIPDSVKYIGDMAFHSADFTTLTIPDSVIDIGDYAFSSCDKLTKLTLSKNLKLIRNHVFANCTSLKTIKIPASVQEIESQAFWNTKALNDQKGNKSEYVDNWLISVNEVSNYKYTVKDGVVGIADYAVHPTIYDVTVPKSVKYIPPYTFGYGFSGASYKKLRDQDFVLRCESGSAALEYAKKNGLHYKLLGCSHERISGWITDEKATVYAPGKRHKACLDCGKTVKTGTIAQLKCSAPKLKAATAVSGGVKITWSKVTGADYYNVYRKTAKTSWVKLSKTSSTSYTDKTAKSGTKYTYTVRALNAAGSSSYDKTGISIQLKCSAPKLKKAYNVSAGVKITWSKSTGANYYNVYRKTAKTSWEKIGKTSSTSYTDKTAKSGTKYTYTVRAVNAAGSSSYNKTGVSVKYLAATKVTVKAAAKKVSVSWKKTAGADGYVVYRKVGNGSYKELKTIKSAKTLAFADKSVKKGTTYTYRVKAYSGKTYSAVATSKAVKAK